MTGRDLLQRTIGGRQRPGGQREPRDEGDALAGRGIQQRFGGASGQVVHVLHRHDRGDLLCGGELIDVDLGQADMPDLAFLLQRDEFADLVGQREVGVDAVQLEQVDGLDAEAAQAHFAFLTQITGVAQRNPHVRPGPQQPGFGCDDESLMTSRDAAPRG